MNAPRGKLAMLAAIAATVILGASATSAMGAYVYDPNYPTVAFDGAPIVSGDQFTAKFHLEPNAAFPSADKTVCAVFVSSGFDPDFPSDLIWLPCDGATGFTSAHLPDLGLGALIVSASEDGVTPVGGLPEAGVSSHWALGWFSIDTVGPDAPSIIAPASGQNFSSGVRVPMASEELFALECSLDGAAYGPCPRGTSKIEATVGYDTSLSTLLSPSVAAWNTMKLWGDPIDPTGSGTGTFRSVVTLNWSDYSYASELYSCAAMSDEWARQNEGENPRIRLYSSVNWDNIYAEITLDCAHTGPPEITSSEVVPAGWAGLANGPHSVSVRGYDAIGNRGAPTVVPFSIGSAVSPRLTGLTGLRVNNKTRVTTLTLKAATGGSYLPVTKLEYSNRSAQPKNTLAPRSGFVRAFAPTVKLPAGQVAFWVRIKDNGGHWSIWYRTRFKPSNIGW